MHRKMLRRRSIRKYQQRAIPQEILEQCVDAARLSPSGANRQPLKYVIINNGELLKKVFTTLRWAGYLPEYQPSIDEMPMAYIIILLDQKIANNCGHDAGIAAMSISMVAYDEGLGSCILGAVDRESLGKILKIPDDLKILLVVALGYPAEEPISEKMKKGDQKYWLDKQGVLHVPKREFEDIVHWNV
jgi:nitroreductase